MSKVKLPNFLVVGAAKSGTTSLYNYLKQHPDVSLNDGKKETRFFTNVAFDKMLTGPKDESMSFFTKNMDEYQELYKNATKNSIGEVSPDYLFYHKKTIPKIKEMLGDVKIIIILRNPVERAFSSYMHLIRDGKETLTFTEGLAAEEERTNDQYWFIWYYKHAGLYFRQVENFLNNFSNVKIYLYDDLKNDSNGLMKDMFGFIGVDETFQPDTSQTHNASGQPKSMLINKFIRRPNIIKSFIKKLSRLLHVDSFVQSITKTIIKINDKSYKKKQIDESSKFELIKYFKNDVTQLEKLIDRDLSHWLK